MPFLGKEPAFDLAATADLGDDIVTEAKMANDAIGLPELKAGTDGELITWDASGNPTTVAAGTSGHFLKSQGAGSVPVFAAVSSGGTAVLARATFSGASTVDITAFDNSNYDAYKIYWEITPSADGCDLLYRTSTDGGSSFDSSSGNYAWRHIINDGGSPPVDYNLTSTTEGRTTRRASNGGALLAAGTGEHGVGEISIIAPDNTGYTLVMSNQVGFHTNGVLQYSQLWFARLSAADVDAFQMLGDTGTLSGRYVLLGIKNST